MEFECELTQRNNLPRVWTSQQIHSKNSAMLRNWKRPIATSQALIFNMLSKPVKFMTVMVCMADRGECGEDRTQTLDSWDECSVFYSQWVIIIPRALLTPCSIHSPPCSTSPFPCTRVCCPPVLHSLFLRKTTEAAVSTIPLSRQTHTYYSWETDG